MRDVSDAFAIVKPGVHKATRPESLAATCAMQWQPTRAIATCLATGLALALSAVAGFAAPAPPHAPELGAAFLRAPLAGALVITDGFGAVRSNHFHAGVDLSTGGRVGADVFAPLQCTLVRVRASGAGYGRSLYLMSGDGRMIVFGHLDAFAPAVAAYVDSAQRASGRYEQDLQPAPGRFAFAAGERVAWSGESGDGPPHLHMEVRHGDFALHPLLAGLHMDDRDPPVLDALTLEPLEAGSFAQGLASPVTRALTGIAAETLIVQGRVRAVVRAHDVMGAATALPPWSVQMDYAGQTTTAAFDSISWDGEMSQLGMVIDRGRIAGGDGVILDAPEGVRPRFLSGGDPAAASKRLGVIALQAGEPARALTLTVWDAAGNAATRKIYLRGPRAGEGPDTTQAHGLKPPVGAPRWTYASLPDKWVRVRVSNVPAGLMQARIERGRDSDEGHAATWDGSGWSALVRCKGIPDEDGFWFKAKDKTGKAWWTRGSVTLWPAGADLPIDQSPLTRVSLLPTRVFEGGVVMGALRTAVSASKGEWHAMTPVVSLEPSDWPLAQTATVTLKAPDGMALDHLVAARRSGDGETWEWAKSTYDAATRVFTMESASFGQFALMHDTTPPRVTPLTPPRVALAGAYSRWALTAAVSDAGSGIDRETSAFQVDGERVPTEYDAEAHVLRWRALRPPAAGRHTYTVEVADRAGNRTRSSGVFVLDSAAHH